jgi:ribonuclease HI
MVDEIVAYTDGSASVAGTMKGYSGFGTFFPNLFGKKAAYSMGFENGKTGEMEVLALLIALRKMPLYSSVKLTVYADSEYVVKTFTENRLKKWKENGWTNTSGEVANKRLWILIDREILTRPLLKLELKHIKSHQVDKEKCPIKKAELMSDPHIIGNLMADKLADYKRHSSRLLNTQSLNL